MKIRYRLYRYCYKVFRWRRKHGEGAMPAFVSIFVHRNPAANPTKTEVKLVVFLFFSKNSEKHDLLSKDSNQHQMWMCVCVRASFFKILWKHQNPRVNNFQSFLPSKHGFSPPRYHQQKLSTRFSALLPSNFSSTGRLEAPSELRLWAI